MHRTRYFGLDCLRGVAALLILMYHLGIAIDDRRFFGFGFLAVDMFFILSGFVIGAVYEERLRNGLSPIEYLVRIRLGRMYPMIALGSILGAISVPLSIEPVSHPAIAFLFSMALVPRLSAGDVFPLNGVFWSLFLELGVNAVHAFIAPILSTKALVGLVCAAALGLIASAYRFHGIDTGWGFANLGGGVARASFSFSAGLLINRLRLAHRLPRIRLPLPLAVLILIGATTVPHAAAASGWAPIYSLFVVMIIFPVLIAGTANSEQAGGVATISQQAGFISYPLYAIQVPILHMAAGAFPAQQHSMMFWSGLGVMLIALSWLVYYGLDRPSQKLLRQRFTARSR